MYFFLYSEDSIVTGKLAEVFAFVSLLTLINFITTKKANKIRKTAMNTHVVADENIKKTFYQH